MRTLEWISDVSRTWSSNGGRKRLLVVDDDRALLTLLNVIFQDEYDVRVTPDGRAAIAEVEDFQPHLIILDLEMPGMNGRNVYRGIRQRHSGIPVLILSAFGAVTAQQELGAQAAMNKPFEPDRLMALVVTLLAENTSLNLP